MNQFEVVKGSRKVIATRNDESSPWSARLYLNGGEDASSLSKKLKTEAGIRRWANSVL